MKSNAPHERRFELLTGLDGLSTLVIATAVGAQERTESPVGSEPQLESAPLITEIIVTARRRSESLKDVPAAVTVLDAGALTNARVDSLLNVGALVPNLNITNQARQGITLVQLRGLNTVQGGESPVTVLIDGVQNPSLDFLNQDFGEIESVQVLGGPQGAVYGRGAIGGAILITTKQPTDELTGSATARYSSGDSYRLSGTLSGPVSEGVSYFRLQTSATGTDGRIMNHYLGEPADLSHRVNVRGQLLFKLDSTDIDLRAAYTRGTDGAAVLEPVTYDNVYDFSFGPSVDKRIIERTRRGQFSAKIDHEIAGGTLTSISQYAFTKSEFTGDTDFTPQPLFLQYNDNPVEGYNQDLRFASRQDAPVRWMLGGFYQWRRTINEVIVSGDTGAPQPGAELFHARQRDTSGAYAAYGQFAIDLNEDLELATALRYDVEERDAVDELVPGSAISHTFNSLQPQITLRQRLSPRASIYASVGSGFRSGGFNGIQDSAAAGLPRLFDAEESTNYEVGAKLSSADGRFNANVAGFYTALDDQQVFLIVALGGNLTRNLVNIPKTDIYGLDLTASYAMDFGLSLNANLGVTRSEASEGPFEGNKSPQVQAYNFNLAMNYERPLWAGTDGFGRIVYSGHGRVYWDMANSASADPAEYLSAQLGVRLNGNVEVSVFGDNLTDEREPSYLAIDTFGPGVHARFDNLPRSYGVEARWNF